MDDDPQLTDALTVGLQFHWQGAKIVTASDGASGVELFLKHRPEFVIVDGDLPEPGAFEAVREIRAVSPVPIIVLTPSTEGPEAIRALDLGADTYVAKPFSLLVLIARTKALLRRANARMRGSEADFVCGDLTVDFQSQTVTLRGAPVKLTPTEYRVLYQLVRNAGRVTSREVLSRLLWDDERAVERDYLKVFVCRLRAKIEAGSDHKLIVTERGRGYRFVVPRPSSQSLYPSLTPR